MRRACTLSVIALASCVWAVSVASAEDSICGPAPSLPTTASVTETIKGELKGQADILSKLVGKAELAGLVEAARNSLYQSSDAFFAAQKDAYLAYLFCSIITKDNALSTPEKLKALQEFRKPITSSSSASGPSPQESFEVDSRGLGLKGTCRRSGQSVVCNLNVVNRDATQDIVLGANGTNIYDSKSRVYRASEAVLAGNRSSSGAGATLLQGHPADAAIQFNNVPLDVMEIDRMEIAIYFSKVGGWAKIVVDSPVSLGK
jgi:hypothetical protein